MRDMIRVVVYKENVEVGPRWEESALLQLRRTKPLLEKITPDSGVG